MAEYMFPNVAYRATVYRTGVLTIKIMDFDHVPNPGIM
jgi:hypothetical protein